MIIMALSASLCWGISDYLGGLKSRTVALPLVLAVSQLAGLALVAGTVAVTGPVLPAGDRLGFAIGAGLVSIAVLALLYTAMARGSMVVVAPIAATGVIIPVVIGIASGEAVGPLAVAGIVLAVLGCVVASWEPAGLDRGRRVVAGALLAAAAAVGIGMFFTLLDAASVDDPYAATFAMRLAACVPALAWLARRPAHLARLGRMAPGTLLALAAIGVTDALGGILFAVAASGGLLSVTSVLASLYPVVTVTLATTVLRERVHWLQFCGAATALVGVVLLARA